VKKITHALLFIFFAHSCTAQLIDLRSALSYLSENKLAVTLCALGVGAIYFGKAVEKNRKLAETHINSHQSLIDYHKNRNANKIGIYITAAKAKKIEQSNFSTDEFEKMKTQCNEEAKLVANLIGTQDYPFTANSAESPQNYSNQFYHLRFVPGYITYAKIINCTHIEQRERFACWMPKISYAIGGLSLLGAGIVAATKIASK
jgi:hypothetical protein